MRVELCQILGDGARSGDEAFCGVGLRDAVCECDAFDDTGQLVCAVELAPFVNRRRILGLSQSRCI